jgi:D-tyrosyl-tRNA(Tyr) deacylase
LKAVVQRVRGARVTVEGKETGSIDRGLLVYLGVAAGDTEKDADWMADRVANLRIFEDSQEKMNLSIKDIIVSEKPFGTDQINGPVGILTVSQFTLLADARKGRRPYYGDAAEPELASSLYEHFMKKIREQGLVCESGIFQARMDVSYTNEGPVTILLDSREQR